MDSNIGFYLAIENKPIEYIYKEYSEEVIKMMLIFIAKRE